MLIGQSAHQGVVQVGPGIDLGKFASLDPELAAEVRAYDAKLIIYYDVAVARYGIARLGQMGLHFIRLWQDDDTGLPLPMDRRLMAAIRSMDLWGGRADPGTANEEANRRDAADDARRARADASFDDDIDHATRSNRRQLVRAAAKHFNVP